MRAWLRRFSGQRLPLPLLVVVILASLPVTLPWAMLQHGWIERRKQRRAQKQRCGRCGAVLGSVAMACADAAWQSYLEKLHREHPFAQFRLNRTVWATCIGCGQDYDYDEAADEFLPLYAIN